MDLFNMATSVLTNQATVKNCIGWTFSPSSQIGSPGGILTTTATGLDHASKFGCKSQSYTSWNCISRLYVGGVYIVASDHQVQTKDTKRDRPGDIPTPEDLDSFYPIEKILYNKGLRIFVRGKGLLTKTQYDRTNPSTTSKDAAVGSNGATTAGDDPPDPNLGYYYSDILPVRSVTVSSMVCQRETEPMPYSPLFQAVADMLNDPAPTDIFGVSAEYVPIMCLVKSLMLYSSTRYEIAAMLRCGAMAMSVAEESFATDPIPYRFVRKPTSVSTVGMDILQKPGVAADTWKIIAMPLDTFVTVANNSCYATSGFTYCDLDINWIAIPVPTRLIGQSHLLAYIYSFLSSDAWSGTASYMVVTDRIGPGGKAYTTVETLLPVVNGINVPGVRSACIVLIDATSQNAPNSVKITLRDVTVNIPVMTGTNEVAAVSSWPLWDKFWNKDNIPGIRQDTVSAHAEICTILGVSDACNISSSLLAELYGQWYNGVAPQLGEDDSEPNWSEPAYGAWTYDGSPLDKTSKLKSYTFNLDQPDKVDARRRTVAYNFSGISPQHVFPTGVVRARYVDVGSALRVTWSTQQPEFSVPSYKIQTMSSIYRVATALGLVLTHTESNPFAYTPTRFVHWVHMLSCAISFSTSAFLSINDITPRDWAGIYKFDNMTHDSVIETLKDAIYSKILVHHDIENMYSNISEWDLDISDYWLMNPYSNVDWMIFSPVPSHCTQQWIEKMGLSGGVAPKGTSFIYKNLLVFAIQLLRDSNEHKMNAVATIDMYRQYPQIFVREPGKGYTAVLHWVDNVAGYSNAAFMENMILETDMYESLTFCASINNIGISCNEPSQWHITGSNYQYNDPVLSKYSVTSINWPNPPLLDTLWQGAKNYILKPAASALADFLSEDQQEQQ